VTVSEASALEARHNIVIPNATAGGTPRTNYAAKGPLRLLFLNLVSPEKGAAVLVEAFSLLVHQGVNAHLRLVGEIKGSDYTAKLRHDLDRLRISDRVQLTGPLFGAAKWDVFAAADIFCFPTLHPQESFGLVIVEAASCGLPIVASRAEGVQEVLTDTASFTLVTPGDPAELAAELARLARDTDARKRLGEAALAEYTKRYQPQHYWNTLDSVFRTLRTDLLDSGREKKIQEHGIGSTS
jgi:glycosyltransferase involved in cell wall biosynthesis